MRKFLIITHKTLATGFKDSIDFFTSDGKNIIAISSYENGKNKFPDDEVEKVIAATTSDTQLFILTDLLGGSVNQKCSRYVDNNNIVVITGVNLSLALALVLEPKGYISLERIQEIINQAKEQMILMNTYLVNNVENDE